jgi:hypothetical protein
VTYEKPNESESFALNDDASLNIRMIAPEKVKAGSTKNPVPLSVQNTPPPDLSEVSLSEEHAKGTVKSTTEPTGEETEDIATSPEM